MKYIDAEKLKKLIDEKWKELADKNVKVGGGKWDAEISTYLSVLRLINSLQEEQPNNMIQWNGNNLKEVIDFTGKSPKFGEWFKSWEEYENYVHSHNNIFKLFCEDGSHYEVPVGSWIVKTPDGFNVPSLFKFVQKAVVYEDDFDSEYGTADDLDYWP